MSTRRLDTRPAPFDPRQLPWRDTEQVPDSTATALDTIGDKAELADYIERLEREAAMRNQNALNKQVARELSVRRKTAISAWATSRPMPAGLDQQGRYETRMHRVISAVTHPDDDALRSAPLDDLAEFDGYVAAIQFATIVCVVILTIGVLLFADEISRIAPWLL